MIYRIHRTAFGYQAQVKGAHNWVPLQDDCGGPMTFPTEVSARCEIQRRITEFGAGPYQHKQRQFSVTEAG